MVQHADIDHTGITGVGGALTVEDEGTPLATGATTLDFVGAGVTASGTGAEKTITIPGSSGGLVAYDINIYTGGDITFNNTTLSAVSGPTDLVVAASAGDVLMVGLSARCPNSTAQSMTFDFATIVSASPVNYVSPASGTPVNVPTPWYIGSADQGSVNGPFPYVVQGGDISGGNVTLRLYARSSGSRVIAAAAAQPLVTWVTNLGQ